MFHFSGGWWCRERIVGTNLCLQESLHLIEIRGKWVNCCCCCCCWVTSVVSNSVWPHRQQPTTLPCPGDSPGKNPGVGCHFLLQCIKVKSESEVTQSRPTVRDPMDCSLPGRPWDFPGKRTGAGCHCLLQEISSLCNSIAFLYFFALIT